MCKINIGNTGCSVTQLKMIGIKFVPTSEWRVQHRTEECAERTWERETGAPLVPVQRYAFLMRNA